MQKNCRSLGQFSSKLKKVSSLTEKPKLFSTYLLKENYLEVNDRAYGNFTIKEPYIIKVFKTKIFQKTLKITQHGVPGLIGWSAPISRGEHMFGAFLLVRKLTENQEEQLAALVHDITHRTFSHLIDLVFRDSLHGSSKKKINK